MYLNFPPNACVAYVQCVRGSNVSVLHFTYLIPCCPLTSSYVLAWIWFWCLMSKGENLCIKAYLNLRGKLILKGFLWVPLVLRKNVLVCISFIDNFYHMLFVVLYGDNAKLVLPLIWINWYLLCLSYNRYSCASGALNWYLNGE